MGWPAKKGIFRTKFNVKDVFVIADGGPIPLKLRLVLDIPFKADVDDSTNVSVT